VCSLATFLTSAFLLGPVRFCSSQVRTFDIVVVITGDADFQPLLNQLHHEWL
jgi:hypothetical protein